MATQRRIVDLRKPRLEHAKSFSALSPAPRNRRTFTLRQKKRRDRILVSLLLLTFLGAIVYGIGYVSYLPQFNLHLARVSGTETLPSRLVSAYIETVINDGSSPFISKDNIAFYNPDSIQSDLMNYFPVVKSARVMRASMLASAVSIEITERKPYAVWCDVNNKCYLIDESGFIYDNASTTWQAPYIFKGDLGNEKPIGQTLSGAHFPGLVVLLRLLGQAGFSPQTITVESDRDFSIKFAEKFVLRASFGSDAGTLARNLKLVLDTDPLKGKQDQIEYIDLRFGDRVYYKLRGFGQVATST